MPRLSQDRQAEIRELRREVRTLKAEKAALRREAVGLRRDNCALRRENCRLKKQLAETQAALEAAERRSKRQAAPFSKGKPKANPKKPGRKRGARYGKKAHRRPPKPEQIDVVYEAPLPDSCPHCGGRVEHSETIPQYQVEIPCRPIYRQFNVHLGHCQDCGCPLRGRHPLQTSDALGAAGSQLGPRAQAAVVFLNKNGGLSHGKISRVFYQVFGIPLSRGGSAQIVLRASDRCRWVHQQIEENVWRSPWVVPDETGWKIGGRRAWLHTLVGPQATYYQIDRSRGAEVAAGVLGWDWPGVLIHDGLASYDRFTKARHQQCLQHVLHRARQMLSTAKGAAVHFPRRVINILEHALRLRDLHQSGQMSEAETGKAIFALAYLLQAQIAHRKHNPANERLRQHLQKHFWDWFLFLFEPGIDATNYRAEQALRLGVINRKVWGGNRTDAGTTAQEILMSVIATCLRHELSPVEFISRVLCGWTPQLIPP